MKAIILVTLLAVAVNASVLEDHAAKFQAFKVEHSKVYKNQVEETQRFAIFRDNLRAIDEHNILYEQGLSSYKQGVNKFSDLTQEEFREYLTLHKKPVLNTTKYVKTGVAVSSSVDWRTQGQVTAVKDQGQCGSCWAFSLTGSTEAAYFRQSGNLVSLSEQQLVDCTTSINYGCDGGFLEATFPYIGQYGLESEASYPYKGVDGSCKYDSSKVVTKVNSYVTFSEDESALLEVVGTIGPVSVTMDASYLSSYSSGIYADSYCTTWNLNHAVLVVGYGSENGKDYWIVKNSWAADWGEQGYFRLLRGRNECGVTEDDTYPIVN